MQTFRFNTSFAPLDVTLSQDGVQLAMGQDAFGMLDTSTLGQTILILTIFKNAIKHDVSIDSLYVDGVGCVYSMRDDWERYDNPTAICLYSTYGRVVGKHYSAKVLTAPRKMISNVTVGASTI